MLWEELEDTKGVIRPSISKKNRQHNGYIQQDYVWYNIKDNPHSFYQYISKGFIDNIIVQFIEDKLVYICHNISADDFDNMLYQITGPPQISLHFSQYTSRRFWQRDVSLEYKIQISIYLWGLWLIEDIDIVPAKSHGMYAHALVSINVSDKKVDIKFSAHDADLEKSFNTYAQNWKSKDWKAK